MIYTDKFIGEQIKMGFTQAQLAGKVGCIQAEISKIEAGERNIRASRLFEICEVLAVSITELLDSEAM